MFELKVVTRFAAAHQLTMVGDKCENLHGHNWKIEVCVGGDTLNEAGVLVDFGIIKGHVREIMGRVDHKFLNELECFDTETYPPSSENLAVYIAEELAKKLEAPGLRVTQVTTWESENACATYIPPV
jgi:6-pyruvoyltetrahydropterin/6-carboxytetrahydropterin synthase